MKNINQLVEEVKSNPEFRSKFVGLDEEGINQMLKDEGYDVTMEEVAEASKNIDIPLNEEELEKIAGGKDESDKEASLTTLAFALVGTVMCLFG